MSSLVCGNIMRAKRRFIALLVLVLLAVGVLLYYKEMRSSILSIQRSFVGVGVTVSGSKQTDLKNNKTLKTEDLKAQKILKNRNQIIARSKVEEDSKQTPEVINVDTLHGNSNEQQKQEISLEKEISNEEEAEVKFKQKSHKNYSFVTYKSKMVANQSSQNSRSDTTAHQTECPVPPSEFYKEENQDTLHYCNSPFRNMAGKEGIRATRTPSCSKASIENFNDGTGALITEYCNWPGRSVTGDEGEVSDEYELETVHLVIRHGDRAPMKHDDIPQPLKHQLNINCKVNRQLQAENPKLRRYLYKMKLLDVYYKQHRGVSPFPSSRSCRYAELTPTGILQHILNGEHLRKVYVDKWKLLDEEVMNIGDMYVRSTFRNYNRTFHSAMALLYGFLPNLDHKNLNLELKSYNVFFCSDHWSGLKCECEVDTYGNHKHFCDNCPLLQELLSKRKFEMKLQRDSHLTMSQLNWKFLDLFDMPLPGTTHIHDVFMGYACRNRTLPISRGYCTKPQMVQDVVEFVDLTMKDKGKSIIYEKYCDLATHPLLMEIATRMGHFVTENRGERFIMYSGHDSTLTPLMVTLGIYNKKWPPFASRLVLELYSHKTKTGKYFIRVLFNGTSLTHRLKFCKGQHMCPLGNFISFVKTSHLKQSFGTESFVEACQMKVQNVL